MKGYVSIEGSGQEVTRVASSVSIPNATMLFSNGDTNIEVRNISLDNTSVSSESIVVYSTGPSSFTLRNVKIFKSSCGTTGNGVFMDDGDINILNSTIILDTCNTRHRGVKIINSTVTLNIIDTYIEVAGGVFNYSLRVEGGDITIRDSHFKAHLASDRNAIVSCSTSGIDPGFANCSHHQAKLQYPQLLEGDVTGICGSRFFNNYKGDFTSY